MINARYGHCMVVLEGSIWVCGGREYGDDETGILSACERFDFGKEKWKSIPNLQYPRAGAGAVVYGEHIYIFGGYSGKGERTRVIESYHEGDSSWRKLPYHLHEGLEGFLLIQNPTNPASIFIFGGKNDDGKLNSVV
jgi:N-acetylneuraminic acid mutarotase